MTLKTILGAALAAVCLAASAAPELTPTQAVLELVSGPVNNLSCGLPPLPPLGCKVGDCVCDSSGTNCRWTFVCK